MSNHVALLIRVAFKFKGHMHMLLNVLIPNFSLTYQLHLCWTMSQSQSLGDTPLNQTSASTGVFRTGTLDDQRSAVLNDLGNIPEVTVDFMLDQIVPDSGINVESTIHDLRRKGILLDSGWREFIDALPKIAVGTEQEVFKKMGPIYENIIASTKFDGHSRRSPTLDMGTNPDIAPTSDKNIKSRPDGCGQLSSKHSIHTSQCGYPSQAKGDYHWFNIAYVEEYKKKNSRKDLNDVCSLLILILKTSVY